MITPVFDLIWLGLVRSELVVKSDNVESIFIIGYVVEAIFIKGDVVEAIFDIVVDDCSENMNKSKGSL